MEKIRLVLLFSLFLFFSVNGHSYAQTSWGAWDKTSQIQDGDFSLDPLNNGWFLGQCQYYWPGGGIRLSKNSCTDPESFLNQDVTGLTSGRQYKISADTDFWGTDPRGGDVHVWLLVYDASSGVLLSQAQRNGGNGWITLEALFTAPASGNVRIQLTGQNYWWEVEAYWDNVVLYENQSGVWTATTKIQDGDFSLNPLTNGWALGQCQYYWPGAAIRLSRNSCTDPESMLNQDLTGLTSGTQYTIKADTDFWGTDPRGGDVHVWLRVYDMSSGVLLGEAQRNGGNDWITLEVAFVAPASGNVRIQITGQNYWWETEAYWDNVILYIDAGKTINDKIIQLQGLITTATPLNIETAYAAAAIQVAWKFLPFVQADLASAEATIESRGHANITALETGLQEQIDSLQNQIQNGVNSYLIVPDPTMSSVTVQSGEFYAGTNPVVMMGPHTWLWEAYDDRNMFATLGFNSLEFAYQPGKTPNEGLYDASGYLRTDIAWWAVSDILAAAERSNLYVSASMIHLGQLWDCVARRGYVDIATYRAELNNLINVIYASVINPSRIKHHIIATECGGPRVFESARHSDAYQAWLKSEYGTIENYNNICQTDFKSSTFSDVTFPTSTETNIARIYDRRYYLNRISVDELKYAADLIHAKDPNVIISGYPSYVQASTSAGYKDGFDLEMEMEAYGPRDADTPGDAYFSSIYAQNTIPWQCMWRAQTCAMGQGAVQMDSEFHPANYHTTYPDGWLSGMALQYYIHGLSSSYVWTWKRSDTIDSTLLFNADICLDASKAALDLRRLATPLEAFHKTPTDVVFLYSIPSQYAQSYFDQMSRCYEGLFFEGCKLGFVTEKQVALNELLQYKLLIIPSAQYVSNTVFTKIQEFLNSGGTVCLVGSCLGNTERGMPRTQQLSSPRLYQYSEFSDFNQARAALQPHLVTLDLIPPVYVQASGSSNRTLEWQYARPVTGGYNLLYLYNMGPNTLTVSTSVTGTDLITGTAVSSTFTLGSLETKIIQFADAGLYSSLFYDGFESGTFTSGGWTNSGADIQTSYKYVGNYASRFNYSDSITKSFSTIGKKNIQVRYARYTRSCETDDHFICEWYNGSTWITLEDLTGNRDWAIKAFNLPASANNNANFKIRFRTSHNGSLDYAYVDEVEIRGAMDGDSSQTYGDIDGLYSAINTHSVDTEYDLNHDGMVDQRDMDHLIWNVLITQYGDANLDRKIDIGDLGILAANYGMINSKTWAQGDFNGDTIVDVADLGILAAHYGEGSNASQDFDNDYTKAFDSTVIQEENGSKLSSITCTQLGLPLIIGFALISSVQIKRNE